MRNFALGLVCGLVALAGFASAASASSATVSLIWSSGSDSYDFGAIGDSNVLRIVLTAGDGDSIGGGVTVDYSEVASFLTVTAFGSTMFTPPLPFNLGTTADTGTMVTNINAAGGLGPGQTLVNGASFVLGTITFERYAAGTNGTITVGFTATDHVLDGAGLVIDSTTTLLSAFAPVPVPEPGTISLLGMGLGGLYVVGRRSSRKS